MSFGQGGYGGPTGQGHGRPGGPGGAPDWNALAEAAAAERARRRRWLFIAGGAVATLAIAGVVAAGVVTASGGGEPSGSASSGDADSLGGSVTDQPEPSFSKVAPPPDPEEYIASAEKDKAPLSALSLFPDSQISVEGRAYARTATDTAATCASAASTRLAEVLAANGCDQLLRATYSRDGVAVTVGVAVFADEAHAINAQQDATGNVESLAGGGVPTFCRATACRLTSNSLGRYAYFTVAGYLSGKAVTAEDARTREAVRDTRAYTFGQIMERGRSQALADAERQQ